MLKTMEVEGVAPVAYVAVESMDCYAREPG